jgi:hypothetical protein
MCAMSIRQSLVGLLRDMRVAGREVRDDMRLYHDLLLTGDDAAELLDKIHRKFGTRFDDFNFAAYFPDETEAFAEHLAHFAGWDAPRHGLTFAHLVAVVERGAWFEPDGVYALRRCTPAPVKWASRVVLSILILLMFYYGLISCTVGP